MKINFFLQAKKVFYFFSLKRKYKKPSLSIKKRFLSSESGVVQSVFDSIERRPHPLRRVCIRVILLKIPLESCCSQVAKLFPCIGFGVYSVSISMPGPWLARIQAPKASLTFIVISIVDFDTILNVVVYSLTFLISLSTFSNLAVMCFKQINCRMAILRN